MVIRLRDAVRGYRATGSLRAWALYLPGPGPWVMSWLRKRWVLFRHPHAHIEFQGPVYLGPGFSLDMPRGGTFIVGGGVEFRRGFRAELGPDARVVIGAACNISHNVVISCETSVEIGQRCLFGNGAYIVDGNHKFRDPDKPIVAQGYDYRPIVIGDDVLVLTKATIVNSLGDHAVVGANSLVTKPVPPYCVAGGVPARVIDDFGPLSRSASSTSTSG